MHDMTAPIMKPVSASARAGRREPPRVLVSDVTLGLLVLLLTVLTAWAGYESELAGGAEQEANLAGQRKLTESSTLALTAVQGLAQDASSIDNYIVHQGDPELAGYFQGKLSDELLASTDLDTGEINEGKYLGAVFADATAAGAESERQFATAEGKGDASDSYQLVMLVFALGMALAGIGSLRADRTWLRGMFSISAFATLAFGGVIMAGIDFVALTG